MPLITSGPWESVYASSDSSEAYQTKLYSAQNVYKLKGGSSFTMRPPFTTKVAGGVLGTSGGRGGQCGFEHVALNGTVYRFVFIGGKVYRWDGNLTFTDVTPTGVTIDSSSFIYCVTFADNLVVTDGLNPPWYVPSSGCGATPLVATTINVDSVPSTWRAFGPPAVYDGRLFFVADLIGGTPFRDTIVWSEVAAPATGYKQTNYADFWELFQTDTRPIYGIAATELSLVVFREQSILNITGKTDATFQTNATKESVEGIGTTSPASILVHDGIVWFLDAVGRQYRYEPGGTPDPLWAQMADIVTNNLSGGRLLAGSAQACYHPDLQLVLSTSFDTAAAVGVTAVIQVFDAVSGFYYGQWDVDGLKLVHRLFACRDDGGHISLCVIGESTSGPSSIATEGQVWRQLTLREMVPGIVWTDPSGVPNVGVITHHLGRNEEGEWIFDQFALRAVETNSTTAGRTIALTYYTPRGATVPPSAVLSYPPQTPVTVNASNFYAEARAVWGLGPNAQGRWFMAVLLASTTPIASNPFTATAVELRGQLTEATPQAA